LAQFVAKRFECPIQFVNHCFALFFYVRDML
jgi:hypothetical protein